MKFERLDVWRRSAGLAADVYKALAELRDFGYKEQVTRSCLSISSNIAEGCERSGSKDRQRFLDFAKGSVAEFISQIYIGRKIGYIGKGASNPVYHLICCPVSLFSLSPVRAKPVL